MADMVVGFTNWLWDALRYIAVVVANFFVDIANGTITGISLLAVELANMLPDYTVPSPGQLVDSSGFLSTLNWLLPITFFINCLAMMVFAYGVYHIVGPALRWIKLLR